MTRCGIRNKWQRVQRARGVRLAIVAAATVFGLLPGGAHADSAAPGDSISILPGYALPPRQYGTSGRGFTFSGVYGHPVAPHLSVEVNVNGSIFETAVPGGTDFYQKGIGLDLLYSLNDRLPYFVTPFALVGIGGAYDDFEPDSDDRGVFLIEAGLGLISRPLFDNGIRLRADIRWVHDSNEGGRSGYRELLGIYIPLGRTSRAAPTQPPVAQLRTRGLEER